MNFYQNSPLTQEPKTSRAKSIGVFVAIIAIVIIVVVVLYNRVSPAPQGISEDQRAQMLAALKNETITPPTAEQRAQMSAALKSETITPPTAEQKASMVKALNSGQ